MLDGDEKLGGSRPRQMHKIKEKKESKALTSLISFCPNFSVHPIYDLPVSSEVPSLVPVVMPVRKWYMWSMLPYHARRPTQRGFFPRAPNPSLAAGWRDFVGLAIILWFNSNRNLHRGPLAGPGSRIPNALVRAILTLTSVTIGRAQVKDHDTIDLCGVAFLAIRIHAAGTRESSMEYDNAIIPQAQSSTI
ncbi:predicted protein [Sclerotinia sclerotiorum 1980 UF-70]|uniref:Uncharacterized protein n=1 Tax=Sclerotinia sclerotiorum (strain ATCC 18683 / 1980 / Ss-1) TaxID=665079 RepID=A7EGG7_SCLS1|nr:predicted protein [Sclerotinia sclerotiorum 1980 UF-70]EDO01933.1 predicted protein [Sclerotinia sclerotiorum 1980 UF-70]